MVMQAKPKVAHEIKIEPRTIPFIRTSNKKLLQEEDFIIVPFVFNSSSGRPSSSRYVESRLEDNRLETERYGLVCRLLPTLSLSLDYKITWSSWEAPEPVYPAYSLSFVIAH